MDSTEGSLEEVGDALCQRISNKVKSEMILHGFARLEARKQHVDYYQVVYTEALIVEDALIATGVFTCDVKTPVPAKNIREQRIAALGDGPWRGDDESRCSCAGRGYGGEGHMKDQFCLAYASRALGLSGRECSSGCERCASHNKAVREFHKGLSDDAILEKFPPSARR